MPGRRRGCEPQGKGALVCNWRARQAEALSSADELIVGRGLAGELEGTFQK